MFAMGMYCSKKETQRKTSHKPDTKMKNKFTENSFSNNIVERLITQNERTKHGRDLFTSHQQHHASSSLVRLLTVVVVVASKTTSCDYFPYCIALTMLLHAPLFYSVIF